LADKSSKRNADEITPAADKFGHRQDYKPRLANRSGLSFSFLFRMAETINLLTFLRFDKLHFESKNLLMLPMIVARCPQ